MLHVVQGNGKVPKESRSAIHPLNLNQQFALAAIGQHDVTFLLGPAGTGKTYLATAAAVEMMQTHWVEKLLFSRPAVEAGERLGFLPGDLNEKILPYLRPIHDCLHDTLGHQSTDQMIANGRIEIAPLGYMRGRTLTDTCAVLDEAQNTTPTQMKMFLTRLGEGSKMIVTGDVSQSDLPEGVISGLADAVTKLLPLKTIAFVHFSPGDVVRHPLVSAIINAYDQDERPQLTPA